MPWPASVTRRASSPPWRRWAWSRPQSYTAAELAFADHRPLVMTAKDAVKCRGLAPADSWVLEVEARPDAAFIDWLQARLMSLSTQ